jgi:two-component system response regulator YesN
LIIADDEAFIREGLESFEWDELGFTAAGSASNGARVLEMMEISPVDVVITDIKMPVMDGLDLSRTIKERFPECRIILLTGYSDFTYAREAIKSGVYEYLLKPVDISELRELFVKLKGELDENRVARNLAESFQSKLRQTLPIAAGDLMKKLVAEEGADAEETVNRLNRLDIMLDKPHFCCVCFQIARVDDAKKAGDALRLQSIVSAAGAMDPPRYFAIVFQIAADVYAAAFNFDIHPGCADLEGFILEVVNGILYDFNAPDKPEEGISAGIGRVFDDVASLRQSFRQAVLALETKFMDEDKSIFCFWKIPAAPDNRETSEEIYRIEKKLLGKLFASETEETHVQTEAFFGILAASYRNADTIKKMTIDLYGMINRELAYYRDTLDEILQASFVDVVERCRTLSILKKRTLDMIDAVIRSLSDPKFHSVTSSHFAIKQAIIYIRAHYNEKISLNQIAGLVYMNPSYFSIQFKSETGRNFIYYLKECRIEKAKELLLRLDLKIYQVAELAGFMNSKYFTDAFKSFTSMTPLEYRNSQTNAPGR